MPVLVFECGGFLHATSAAPRSFNVRRLGVIYPESYFPDAVSVEFDVLGDQPFGLERCREHKPDFVLLENVRGSVARAGLGPAIGNPFHTECGAVIVGCLFGVTNIEFDIIGAIQRQEVSLLLHRVFG